MKFITTRASEWKEKPCNEAFKDKIKNWHIRTCDEKTFNEMFSEREGLWKSKGINHTIINNSSIARQEGYKDVWMVEIKNLKELMNFVDKHGGIIISNDDNGAKSRKEIKIYDDYIE